MACGIELNTNRSPPMTCPFKATQTTGKFASTLPIVSKLWITGFLESFIFISSNTVDCASVEFVFDDILTNLYGTSPKHLRRANLIPLRTVHRRQPLSSRPAPGTLNLSGV